MPPSSRGTRHYDPGALGVSACGAQFRLTYRPDEVTCKNCLRWIRGQDARRERLESQLNTEKGHPK
jgi:hypothetical protein